MLINFAVCAVVVMVTLDALFVVRADDALKCRLMILQINLTRNKHLHPAVLMVCVIRYLLILFSQLSYFVIGV